MKWMIVPALAVTCFRREIRRVNPIFLWLA